MGLSSLEKQQRKNLQKKLRQTKTLPGAVEAHFTSELASVQIIRLDWQKNLELVADPLDHFQLDLCLSARLRGMRVCFPDRWGELRFERVGELVLIPPGERFIARSDSPDQATNPSHTSTVLRFEPGLVFQWMESRDIDTTQHLMAALDIDNQSIYSLMSRLTQEAMASGAKPSPERLRLLDLIAQQIGIEIKRYYQGHKPVEFKGGLAAWRLRLIDERVHQLREAPSVEELAALCKISPRQLQRGFKVSRGASIGRYVENARIENAKRLLQQGDAIRDVAATLGYSSQSSFSQAFRRATGATPAQFSRMV